jgi:Mn-dependent DtxR family transcriptional regulator
MEITRTELKRLYNTMRTNDLAKKLNISKPTLIKYLKEAGIKLKGKGNKEPKPKKLTIRED